MRIIYEKCFSWKVFLCCDLRESFSLSEECCLDTERDILVHLFKDAGRFYFRVLFLLEVQIEILMSGLGGKQVAYQMVTKLFTERLNETRSYRNESSS